MLTGWRGRGDTGSGMVIGVAIMFPALMLVVVLLQMLSESARIEQSLQATATRAALSAALCCHRTGGPDGAVQVVEASLRSAERANASNNVLCNNDFVGDSAVAFVDLDGRSVPTEPDSDGAYAAVPPAGTVHVYLRCVMPPQILAGFGVPGFATERLVVGSATLDPYRTRRGG